MVRWNSRIGAIKMNTRNRLVELVAQKGILHHYPKDIRI